MNSNPLKTKEKEKMLNNSKKESTIKAFVASKICQSLGEKIVL